MIVRLLFIAIFFICSSKAYDSDQSFSDDTDSDNRDIVQGLRRIINGLEATVDRLEEKIAEGEAIIRKLTEQLHRLYVIHNQCPEQVTIEAAKDFQTKKEAFKQEMQVFQETISHLIQIKFKQSKQMEVDTGVL